MSEDLWGDLPEPESIETAEQILAAQGRVLFERTKFKLQGVVEKRISSNTVHLTFQIRVPDLNNYEYAVLFCEHPTTALYPVDVRDADDAWSTVTAVSPQNFRFVIGKILGSDRVKAAIAAFLAQMRDV